MNPDALRIAGDKYMNALIKRIESEQLQQDAQTAIRVAREMEKLAFHELQALKEEMLEAKVH